MNQELRKQLLDKIFVGQVVVHAGYRVVLVGYRHVHAEYCDQVVLGNG